MRLTCTYSRCRRCLWECLDRERLFYPVSLCLLYHCHSEVGIGNTGITDDDDDDGSLFVDRSIRPVMGNF